MQLYYQTNVCLESGGDVDALAYYDRRYGLIMNNHSRSTVEHKLRLKSIVNAQKQF
jgi:hypothetical protein